MVKDKVVIEHSVSKFIIENSINRNINMKRITGIFEKICTISKNKILYNTIINKQLPTTIKV